MAAINEITILLLNTAISLVMLAFLLRLLLQLVRADFYNPITQYLVKATNPIVLPLRRIIPPVGIIDSASLICALIVQAIGVTLLAQLYFGVFPNPAQIFIWAIIGICGALLNIYFVAIIANIIMSWVSQGGSHPAAQLLYQLTEPVIAPFRKLLPNMGGLDFSPILVFLMINVLEVLLRHLAATVGLHPALVLGI